MISIRIELCDSLVGVESIVLDCDGFRINSYLEGSFFSCVGTFVNSGVEVEISTIRRSIDIWESQSFSSSHVGWWIDDKVLNWFIEFGTSVTSTSDSFLSSNIGESSLIDLEDDNCRVSGSKIIVGECDVSSFVDDWIRENNSWKFTGPRVWSSSIVWSRVDSLGVDVDNGRCVAWSVFKNWELEVVIVTTWTISLNFRNLECDGGSSRNSAESVESDVVETWCEERWFVWACLPGYIVTFYIRRCWDICSVHETWVVRSYCVRCAKPSIVTSTVTKLNSEEVNMTSIIENLVGSCKRAFQMIILIDVSAHTCAGKRWNSNWVRNPLIEDDFKRNWRGSEMTVELNLEEISLDQGVDSYTLIFRLSETFSSDG